MRPSGIAFTGGLGADRVPSLSGSLTDGGHDDRVAGCVCPHAWGARAGAGAIGTRGAGNSGQAMTRYSRSVIPGRPAEDDSNLDRAVFGAKKRPVAPPSDGDYPDPMDMDVDEAGFLVERSDKNRRGATGERRKRQDRRKEDGRRQSDYAPLREDGAARRPADAGNRGPILLVGALVIVAVFGVVVWNAYREGVRTDDPEAAPPQLAASGSFKTPPRETVDVAAAGAAAEPTEVLDQLDGGPAPVSSSSPDVRPEPKPVAPAPVQTAAVAPAPAPVPAPAPSKFTAPPPAPLKAPVATPPVVTAKPPAPIAATAIVTTPASTAIELPKPSAAVVPSPTPAVAQTAYKPAFAAGGSWMAQIAATSSEAGAISEWDRRAKAMPDMLSAAERSIVQADVNGKTVYRVRAGSFASKADAAAFCDAFKAKGGNCLPAAK